MKEWPAAELVALDWGTSSCRAYLVDRQGEVLATKSTNRGVMTVTTDAAVEGITAAEAFAAEFDALCGDWLRPDPVLPVIACGMVGSDQGWAEAAYVTLPVDLFRTPLPLTRVMLPRGVLHIVPGLRTNAKELPDVLRGEETQVLGTVLDAASRKVVGPGGECIVILPGTHTKWVRLSGPVVTDFATSMTGEVYGLLASQSILARLAEAPSQPQWQAYERGLDVAFGPDGRLGVLGTTFSARTLVMADRLNPFEVQDYLSGLLIGTEVAAMAPWALSSTDIPVILCGKPELSERYQRALCRNQTVSTPASADVTLQGLTHIAKTAGLLK